MSLKKLFKRNTHNGFFRALGDFGLVIRRFYENRNHDIHSNGELTVIKKLAKLEPSVIIDGGANTGRYSMILNKHCKDATIYSLEPVKSTFNILSDNTEKIPEINPVNKGLFSSSIEKEINIFPSHTHSSLYDIKGVPYSKVEQCRISLIDGDTLLNTLGIERADFIKLDLEGSEYEALLGFKEAFSKGNIRMVQFEYGYINITTRKLLIDFYDFFEQYGYQVGKIFPKSVEFRPYKFKYEDFIGPNFIAVRKKDKELINLLSIGK
ncbi:MAG: FkbM family methyltransferase [Bacteroidales bacterium]|nr:FkbM family methyltransferase [Bacteroidales bacterium]